MGDSTNNVSLVVARVESVAEQVTLALPDGTRHVMPLSSLLAVSDAERASRLAALVGTDLVIEIDNGGTDVVVRELQPPLDFRTPKDLTLAATAALRTRLQAFDHRLARFDRELGQVRDDVTVTLSWGARIVKRKDFHTADEYAVEYNRLAECVSAFLARYEPRLAKLEAAKT